MLKFLLIIILIVALAGCTNYGSVPSEFEARSVTVDGEQYNYRVFIPKDRRPDEKLPVMLYLHGSGARGDDNVSQVEGIKWAIAPVQEKVRFIIVVPQCRPDTFWAAQNMAEYALAALDSAVNELNGDSQRLYLVGFSLGGYGTWQIAAAHPGKFAALVPVAGGVVGKYPINPRDRDAIIPVVGDMLEAPKPYNEVAKAIGQTPVWVFHGAKDFDVPVQFSRNMVDALKAEGRTDVKYTEYPDDKHQIFGKAFAEPGLFEWLGEQRLDKGK
jgi:Predicted peptidase